MLSHGGPRKQDVSKTDVRTITMGISLLDCAATLWTGVRQHHVKSPTPRIWSPGEAIDDYGIPMSTSASPSRRSHWSARAHAKLEDFVRIARA